MKQVTRHCDRCGQNILEGGAIVDVQAGGMVRQYPECSTCARNALNGSPIGCDPVTRRTTAGQAGRSAQRPGPLALA